jgi:hypothetical protein
VYTWGQFRHNHGADVMKTAAARGATAAFRS